ncbi:hypothetical protein GGTG_00747 [Gaeumannomyces tritici R3-111a-1]|uniref:CorA family metal ion transporter n=1 Tax=Gaeumannomyces tritici (strain R3-111a-1) TaxID=644352 RepID=J3NHL0_GAET3|nr:hypothetical protein GGTG_00747 [Gaeumannomyces tritici R3-111a-1]EJT80753.1 hypothetical protein GGTG_00747 [Gaeumannomyces tritici R3-111a-1]
MGPGTDSSPSRSNGRSSTASPEELYANAVSSYSRQGAEATLFPGPHFERLGTYLKAPFYRRRDTAAAAGFPFFVLYQGLGLDRTRRTEATSPDQVAALARDHPGGNQLLFLRGQPSPEWLSGVGSRFGVDPEYFQRHMDIILAVGRAKYYAQPSLPSASSQVVQLRYFTLSKTVKPSFKADQTDQLRLSARKKMDDYITATSQKLEHGNAVGNSIVRDFSLFSNGRWAIEQCISLCVNRTETGWTAVAWVDTGKDLNECPRGPWKDHWEHSHTDYRAFLPTVQSYPHCSLHPQRESVAQDPMPKPQFAQSASLLHRNYGKRLDKAMMGVDAFYSFHEIFKFCAFSQVQFLNMIEDCISEAVDLESPEHMSIAQSNLVYAQDLLDRQVEILRSTIEIIKARGGPTWPKATTTDWAHPSNEQVQSDKDCAQAAEELRKDFEHLHACAIRLSEACKSKISHLTSRAALAESRKGIDQAREMAYLTRLAFIFIPLGFVTSFFGMNLEPIAAGNYPLWIFFVIAVPFIILALGLMYWDRTSIALRGLLFSAKESARTNPC